MVFMRTLALLTSCLLAVLVATDRGMAHTPPGWTETFQNGMRVARSRADAKKSYVGVLVVPAQPKVGDLNGWFESTVTGKLASIGTIKGRAGLEPFQDWQRDMFSLRDGDGLDMIVIAYGYASDAGYHVSYILLPFTIDRNDERVREAVTYVVNVRNLGLGAPGVAAPKGKPAPSAAAAPTSAAQPSLGRPRKCRTVTRAVDDSKFGTQCSGPYGSSSRFCVPTFTPGTRQVTTEVCD